LALWNVGAYIEAHQSLTMDLSCWSARILVVTALGRRDS
jgi:hypothetical protein